MSKLYTRIIWQSLPPDNTNLLWMKDNALMYFNAGEWIPLIGSNGAGDAVNINNNIRAILDQLIKLKSDIASNIEQIDSINNEVNNINNEVGNINNKVDSINSLNVEIVEQLPENPVRGTIYFIKNLVSTEDNNIYDEYIYIESTNTWEKLGSFVTKTDLSNYITTEILNSTLKEYYKATEVDNKLKSYTTTSTLNTTLSNYVTTTALNIKLKDYSTTTEINTKLNDYITKTSLNTTLGSYVTSTSLNNTLESYATKSSLSDYVKTSALNTKLNDYVTTSSLTTNLKNYLLLSQYNTDKASFATTTALSTTNTLATEAKTLATTANNKATTNASSITALSTKIEDLPIITTGTGSKYLADNGEYKTIASYTLPAATASTLGGVKIGSNITNTSGTISISKTNITTALGYTPISSIPEASSTVSGTIKVGYTASGKNYAIKVDDSGNAYVNVPWENTHNTVTDKAATLTWDTTSTIATIGNTNITVKLPANPNTDTHYTTRLYTGASGATANTAATNPYLAVTDNNTYRNQVRLVGAGATTIASDTSGNITITSTKYSNATTTAAGLMSETDKSKLDNIAWKIIR